MVGLTYRLIAIFALAAIVVSVGFSQPAKAQDVWIDFYFEAYYPYYYGSYYDYGTYYWGYYPAYYEFLWPSYYTLYWDYPVYNWNPYYTYYPSVSYYNYYPPQQVQYNFNYNFNPVCGDNVCSPGEDNYVCPQDCRAQATCYDGTPYGMCSPQQPKQCQNGVLVDNAQACGCPTGYISQNGQCYQANPSCTVSINPQTVRAGDRTQVTVQYSQRSGTGLPNVRVDCGNGQSVQANCAGSGSQQGACTAQCSYDDQPFTPRNVRVQALSDGQLCSDASVRVIAAPPTTGSVLARITDCDNYKPIPGAQLQLFSASPILPSGRSISVYADANGIAQMNELQPASYNFDVRANGYQNAQVSAQAFAGVANPVSVCLRKTLCDVGLSLAGQNGNSFDLLLENRNGSNRTVVLNYSGTFPIAGNGTVYLQGNQSKIFTISVDVPADFVGMGTALVTAQGNACTSSLQLPIDASRGLYIEARNGTRNTLPGKHECFDVLVRNKGADRGTVTMTSNGTFSNTYFDASQFQLSSYESRVVQYCVLVPDSAIGYASQQILATSPLGSGTASVSLYTPQPADFSIRNFNASSCQPIDFEQIEWVKEVQLQNNAFDGSFDVELQKPDNLQVALSPTKLFGFQKDSTRSLYLQFDNSELPQAGYYYVDLYLKQNGLPAWQSELCFSVGAVESASLQLSQPAIQVQRGAGKLVTGILRNTGNYKRTFAISTNSTFQSVSFTPAQITLDPGAETFVEIYVQPAPGAGIGQVAIPIRVDAVSNTGNRTLATQTRLIVDVLPAPNAGNSSAAAVVGLGGGAGAGGLSGFFTLGSSEGALLILLILLAIGGGYLYYRSRENRKKIEQLQGEQDEKPGDDKSTPVNRPQTPARG